MRNRSIISIALCTYNGEKYIEEQLQSIITQSLKPDEIVLCDDCSNDHTIQIVERFAKTTKISLKIVRNLSALGVIKNFEQAISLCSGDYVALSDQDDIWMPDKLAATFDAMISAEKQCEQNTPIAVHSDLCVVDEKRRIISSSFLKAQHLRHIDNGVLKSLMVQNFVTGCTMLMNRPLLQRALPIPCGVIMHDWWLALIAASCGKLVFVDHPTIYYRQHASNVIGARKYWSIANVYKFFDSITRDQSIANTIQQIYLLMKYVNNLNDDSRLLIDKYIRCLVKRKGILVAYEIWSMGVYKQGFWRNLAFYYRLGHAKYKKYLPAELLCYELKNDLS